MSYSECIYYTDQVSRVQSFPVKITQVCDLNQFKANKSELDYSRPFVQLEGVSIYKSPKFTMVLL